MSLADWKKIEAIRRKHRSGRDYEDVARFLVHFKVEQPRRLVGD